MIAEGVRGACVTIRGMTRSALVLLIVLLCSCAGPSESTVEAAADTEALEAVEALEERVTDLESDLAEMSSERDKAGERLEALGDRLDKALERLREALAEVRSSAAGAGDAAASAMSAANSAAAQLDVLEERYEYHLRRYHGGG